GGVWRGGGPERHFRDVHPGAAGAAERAVRRAGMTRGLAPILVAVALLAVVPLVASNVTVNFLAVALLIALVGQGWNLLGGYGGADFVRHRAVFRARAHFP